MKITFFGAAGEVTGSKCLLEINQKKILLDCGMFQGKRQDSEAKNKKFPFDAAEIDAAILSHAHIDHSGLIPLLHKKGFNGDIHATYATRDLCNSMLRDTAKILEKDAEFLRKKIYRDEKSFIHPLYNIRDAAASLELFRGHNYERTFKILPGIKVRFRDAGHILGSSIVEIFYKEEGKSKKLVFTGDLGRREKPIIRDPEHISRADIVIMESTYGNRTHRDYNHEEEKIIEIVHRAFRENGKILIPAFALERTQELLYILNLLVKQKKIPRIKVFVDSPLAIDLNSIFDNHPECFDAESRSDFLLDHHSPLYFGDIDYRRSVEESKDIDRFEGPAIIISASGMCEFGRIRHHIINHISDPRNTILVVGYMAKHTLGRKLVEKNEILPIFGRNYRVEAQVKVLNGLSGHADREDLLNFMRAFTRKPKKLFLNHGESYQSGPLAESIAAESLAEEIIIPRHIGEEFEV